MKHTVVLILDSSGMPVAHNASGDTVEKVLRVEKDDQIRWTSPQGTATVEFPPGKTPFPDGRLTGDQTFQKLVTKGTFAYQCVVTTPDGKVHRWPPGTNDGGTVIVGGGTRSGG